MNTDSARYSTVAIYLHWTIAILMIYMLFWGEDLIKRPSDAFYPSIHASIGSLILILSLARLAWRLAHKPPPDVPMPAWQRTASHAVHWLFYAVLIGMPLTGFAAFDYMLAKTPVLQDATLFGVLPVPHYSAPLLGGAHELGQKVAIALLLLHVAAALKHQFWDKDHLLRRMSPH